MTKKYYDSRDDERVVGKQWFKCLNIITALVIGNEINELVKKGQ